VGHNFEVFFKAASLTASKKYCTYWSVD